MVYDKKKRHDSYMKKRRKTMVSLNYSKKFCFGDKPPVYVKAESRIEMDKLYLNMDKRSKTTNYKKSFIENDQDEYDFQQIEMDQDYSADYSPYYNQDYSFDYSADYVEPVIKGNFKFPKFFEETLSDTIRQKRLHDAFNEREVKTEMVSLLIIFKVYNGKFYV